MTTGWKNSKRYMAAYGAWLGSTDPTAVPKKPKKKKYYEEIEQIKFNIWFDEFLWQKDYRWFHSPNGGSRNPIEGSKFKRMGVKKGIPDIVLPMARKPYHGLVIELKRCDAKMSDVSPEQKDWLEWFRKQQWSDHVAFGFEQAKGIVQHYFREDNVIT